MPAIYRWIWLFFCCWPTGLVAQELQLGGRVGASSITASPLSAEVPAAAGGTAGVFAAWQNRPLRLGLRVEVNYQDRRAQNEGNWQAPLLAILPLDKQRMVELHTGPYVSVKNEPQPGQPRISWGFSTGLQINLPLSSQWLLSTQARADHGWTAPEAELVPARNLSFHLTLGLAYLLQRDQRRRTRGQ